MEYPDIYGTVSFNQLPGGVLVTARVFHLPESQSGFFAMHIHEGSCLGDAEGNPFPSAGGHYNPAGLPHPRHAGDLPPLLDCRGQAFLCVLTDRFRVDDVVGRAVIIHGGADDFTTQPSGNSGTKIACGAIRGEACL